MLQGRVIRVIVMITALMISVVFGEEELPRQTLKSNYQVVYSETPGSVESLSEMLSEGMFYGRLRSNSFYYRWDDEDSDHSTHLISGLGGSLIYKSASFEGFDVTGGLYYSRAFFDDQEDPVAHIKPGKDTLSRYDYANTGNKSMGTLGQAYLRYHWSSGTELMLGRQLVETFYAKSNDAKMIPNTFDGVVISTKTLPQTDIRLAYLYEQKLRDHTQAHSPLMFGDANSTTALSPQWSENDDVAMHRGLTYSALKSAGKRTDAPLITGDLHNTSIDTLKADLSFYVIPELLSQVMGELNYTFTLGEGLSVTPGVRYIRQFDNGAGDVGGASYLGKAYSTGYTDPDSLDAQMIAARLVTEIDEYSVNLGYSQIFDEADLITPWRGFPTAGYTRSMVRYNWRANTKSYRIELQRDNNRLGIFKDLYVQASVLYTDGDDAKRGAHVLDEMYYYVGFAQNLPSMIDLQWRLRLGYTHYLDDEESQFDNLDARFEINYLF